MTKEEIITRLQNATKEDEEYYMVLNRKLYP